MLGEGRTEIGNSACEEAQSTEIFFMKPRFRQITAFQSFNCISAFNCISWFNYISALNCICLTQVTVLLAHKTAPGAAMDCFVNVVHQTLSSFSRWDDATRHDAFASNITHRSLRLKRFHLAQSPTKKSVLKLWRMLLGRTNVCCKPALLSNVR